MKKLILFIFMIISASLHAQDMSSLKIFLNPGHGGNDSNDRNMVIAPYAQGDSAGFWESKTNLHKAFMLKNMLEARGATVFMSRVQNRTVDDLPLSTIVEMANQSNCDFFFSIHSNAADGRTCFPLMLFRGYTEAPERPGAKALSSILWNNFYSNKIQTWTTSTPQVIGDWTFQPGWGTDGYGVLRGLTVDGIISEATFHDYIPETYRLMNMDYKWLESWHFLKTIVEHFKVGTLTKGNIAGTVRDSRNKLLTSYFQLTGDDQLLPIHKAKLTVTPGDQVVYTDDLYNGVYAFRELEPGNYQMKVEAAGYYEQTIPVTVKANETTYFRVKLNKVRNTAPQVLSYSPNVAATDSVNCSETILLNFNWDMDEVTTRAAFSIEPAIAGTLTFEDSQYKLRFTPDKPFDKSTVYTVRLAKTAKHPDNIEMTDDFSFSFKTKSRNRLSLITSNPKAGEGDVHLNPVFRLVFDNKLLTTNLSTSVRVVDNQGAVIAKNVRSVTNNTVSAPFGSHFFEVGTPLTAGKEYKLLIDASVIDVDKLPVVESIEIPFKVKDVSVVNQPVADGFETAANYTVDQNSSAGVTTATAIKSTAVKLFETSSYKYDYAFSDVNAYVVYKIASPTAEVTTADYVGLHVYGDLYGNKLQLQLTSDQDVQYIDVANMNFFGWKFVETSMSLLPTGKSYKVTGVRVLRQNGILTDKGSFYLDNMLIYSQALGIDKVNTAQIKVYPNPATDYIRVDIPDAKNAVLKLLTLRGELINVSQGSVMQVASIQPGSYLMQIMIDDKTINVPVIITK